MLRIIGDLNMLHGSVLYEKALVLLDRRFRFIHGAYFRPARPLPQHSGQFGKLRGIAGRVDLHIAIIAIADPAS